MRRIAHAKQFLFTLLLISTAGLIAPAANAACTAILTPTPAAVCSLSAGNTASLAGAGGNVTYVWTVTNGTITGGQGTSQIAYTAGTSGNVTIAVHTTNNGNQNPCDYSVTVPISTAPPPTPTITPQGPTTFCEGGSVNLDSSSANGNQWYLNAIVIPGATGPTYNATVSGDYTVVVSNGCGSPLSAAVTVTVNPVPATPTVTPDGPTTFCQGGSVNLTSSSGTGNQWYLNGSPISGETNATLAVTATGDYTVVVTSGDGCASAPSAIQTVTVNPTPATPTITPDGPTTLCGSGSVTLTSSSATGNQWFLDGSPIAGETNATLLVSAAGNYTVVVTELGCASSASAAVTVTVNPIPPTPVITPGGATQFCQGGSVTLTSSSAADNQWYADGTPITGATGDTYNATQSGSYTVVVTTAGCSSAASAPVVVTVDATPAAPVLLLPQSVIVGATGVTASVTNNAGSTYAWTCSGCTITGGQGTSLITYDAGAPGTRMTLSVVETSINGCASPTTAVRQMVDFLDVPPSHPFHDFVIKIALAGITAGCGSGNFCPADSATRAEMAVFLLVGEHGEGFAPPPAVGIFGDVPVGSFAANFIEQLYSEGITGGCSANPLLYCPNASVTRAEMAVFLLVAEHGPGYVPPPAGGIFGDVPVGSFAANFIEQLYGEGITGGCSSNPMLYCPNSSTTRGEMSVFLTITFNLP